MRFVMCAFGGYQRYGLVIRHPVHDEDWVFRPEEVERVARTGLYRKGAGSQWNRHTFLGFSAGARASGNDEAAALAVWPQRLSQFLALGPDGMAAARKMEDFLRRHLEQRDPALFSSAGTPLSEVKILPPVEEPAFVLGVVGNNAAFLRNDHTQGRNLHLPACHLRPSTSVVGQYDPIVVPEGGVLLRGTVELGLVIGRGGKHICRADAMDHVAGYTIVNDLYSGFYERLWSELDAREHPGVPKDPDPEAFHYHASNSASWLDKGSDTNCGVGPWIVTPEEVGDPYDLMFFYREGGIRRNRGHSNALCFGIEDLIHWLSQFIELRPGMILHMGAVDQDGIPLDTRAELGPEYLIEAEIERVGALRNPVVSYRVPDWREPEDPSRALHPAPAARKSILEGKTEIDAGNEWGSDSVRHFWGLVGNYRDAAELEGIAPRPYPLAYLLPRPSLAVAQPAVAQDERKQERGGSEGDQRVEVELPPGASGILATCELGFVVKSMAKGVEPENAANHILGLVVLAAFRDTSFGGELYKPHVRDANMPAIYSRWPERFTVAAAELGPAEALRSVGSAPTGKPAKTLSGAGGGELDPEKAEGLRMTFEIDGVGATETRSGEYVLGPEEALAHLSANITLMPGDVVALGRTAPVLAIPAGQRVPEGAGFRATAETLPSVEGRIVDRRKAAEIAPA